MSRSSVALFLVTAGLITATVGCAPSPGVKEGEGGEAGVSTPAPDRPAAGDPVEAPKGADKDHGGEGGEGGEG